MKILKKDLGKPFLSVGYVFFIKGGFQGNLGTVVKAPKKKNQLCDCFIKRQIYLF